MQQNALGHFHYCYYLNTISVFFFFLLKYVEVDSLPSKLYLEVT